MPKRLIILVHGTFAREAEWCAPNSTFIKGLSGQLGDSFEFIDFRWSGHNTHVARRQAGAELTSFIQRWTNHSSDLRVYLLGHSHGGNVIMYSLRGAGISSSVQGVICLDSPFIHTEKSG